MTNKFIVGNWKMNQDLASIQQFLLDLAPVKNQIKCSAWIAPQGIHLAPLLKFAQEAGIDLKVGGQDCSAAESGAFTGETSAVALKNIGASFTLVGHSERRQYWHEQNSLFNEKIKTALSAGLTVIYCVGETLQEREAGKTWEVVQTQLQEGLKDIPLKADQLILAYEPVWAIGTGVTATPEQAGEVHAQIASWLESQNADKLPILYGGSVKPSNIKELLAQPHLDGGLVGGASLKGEDYGKLCIEASS